jgi:uncharacterized protein YciI
MADCEAASGFDPGIFPVGEGELPKGVGDEDGPVRLIVIHKPGPMWEDQSHSYVDPAALQAHIDHYRQMRARGKVVMGGPFLDTGGGMMILSDDVHIEEAREIVQGDPAVRSGLLRAEIRSWFAIMDREER